MLRPGKLTCLCSVRQSNALDLDVDALWELVDGDAGASRTVSKVAFVLAVHGREVGHVGEKDADLDDAGEVRTGGSQDSTDVVNDGRRLLANRPVDQIPFRVCGDLARDVDCGRGLNCLGLHVGGWV